MKYLIPFLLGAALCAQPLGLPVGEHLEYTAQFNVIPAGTATLSNLGIETIDGENTLHMRFEARTGAIADRLFKIRDRIDTWLYLDDLTTARQIKRLREGSYRQKTFLRVDRKEKTITTHKDTFHIAEPIRDPYSLLYYLRTIPLAPGDTLKFNTFDNGTFTRFMTRITRREILHVPAGTYPCLVYSPFRENASLFKNQGDMTVWFSDDEQKLPVQIVIKLKYGSMVMKLKKVKTREINP